MLVVLVLPLAKIPTGMSQTYVPSPHATQGALAASNLCIYGKKLAAPYIVAAKYIYGKSFTGIQASQHD